jgi:hypothetical protein
MNNIWFWFELSLLLYGNWWLMIDHCRQFSILNFQFSIKNSDNPRFIYSRIYFSNMSKNFLLFWFPICDFPISDLSEIVHRIIWNRISNLRAQRYGFFLICKLFWKYFWSFFFFFLMAIYQINKWTEKQKQRSKLFFELNPDILR